MTPEGEAFRDTDQTRDMRDMHVRYYNTGGGGGVTCCQMTSNKLGTYDNWQLANTPNQYSVCFNIRDSPGRCTCANY